MLPGASSRGHADVEAPQLQQQAQGVRNRPHTQLGVAPSDGGIIRISSSSNTPPAASTKRTRPGWIGGTGKPLTWLSGSGSGHAPISGENDGKSRLETESQLLMAASTHHSAEIAEETPGAAGAMFAPAGRQQPKGRESSSPTIDDKAALSDHQHSEHIGDWCQHEQPHVSASTSSPPGESRFLAVEDPAAAGIEIKDSDVRRVYSILRQENRDGRARSAISADKTDSTCGKTNFVGVEAFPAPPLSPVDGSAFFSRNNGGGESGSSPMDVPHVPALIAPSSPAEIATAPSQRLPSTSTRVAMELVEAGNKSPDMAVLQQSSPFSTAKYNQGKTATAPAAPASASAAAATTTAPTHNTLEGQARTELTPGLGTWASEAAVVGRLIDEDSRRVAEGILGVTVGERGIRRQLESGIRDTVKDLPLNVLKDNGYLEEAQTRGLEKAVRIAERLSVVAQSQAWQRYGVRRDGKARNISK